MNNLDNQSIDLIGDAYKNYEKQIIANNLHLLPASDLPSTQEEFIDKIKTDDEFAQRWGVKVEVRELSLDERVKLFSKNVNGEHLMKYANSDGLDVWNEILNKHTIPTKAISLTYNNKTIESYE
jgi:hypothetical protein